MLPSDLGPSDGVITYCTLPVTSRLRASGDGVEFDVCTVAYCGEGDDGSELEAGDPACCAGDAGRGSGVCWRWAY
jgi:hypothetical protein